MAAIDQSDTPNNFRNGETVVGGALIEMLTMRLPERLAPDDAADERDRRIGEIIKRQDNGSSQMAVRGKAQQEPAEHETDRQTAHVA